MRAEDFLLNYDEEIIARALNLRKLLFSLLPGVTEQVDLPAKMIAYCYGQKYSEMICVIIPSKKGLKLGFSRGTELSDPKKILKGEGKKSRYLEIKDDKIISSKELKDLVKLSLKLYKEQGKEK
jgi:hypothetical protein